MIAEVKGKKASYTDIAFDTGAIWERSQILDILRGYVPKYCQQISHQLCPNCEQTQILIKAIELRGSSA
jgi:hypothetical protein